jgi:hypothetical protein
MDRFKLRKFSTTLKAFLRSALISRKTLITVLAFATGAVAWNGHALTIPISLLLFPLLAKASSRGHAFAIAIGYYAGSTWPVLSGAAAFFGPQSGPGDAVLLWISGASILAIPIALLWSSNPLQRLWRIPLAVVLTAIPPIGILNVASPLTAAGVLFPGAAWTGLIAILFIIGGLAEMEPPAQTQLLLGITALALIFNFSTPPPQLPKDWQAINTNFGGSGLNTPSALELYNHEQWIRRTLAQSQAKVLIFPESVVYRWTDATDMFWKPELDHLRATGRTVLVGAGLPLPGPHHYLNALFIRGQDTQPPFLQRIPVPGGMWTPFDGNSVPMRPFGQSVLSIGGERVAPIICYEQLLVWPIVTSMWHKPTLIAGFSNEYWASKTYIPKIQRSALESWSRLFNIPFLEAVNQ